MKFYRNVYPHELNVEILTVIYIHIGKTAGESIENYLKDMFHNNVINLVELHVYNSNEIIKSFLEIKSEKLIYLVSTRDPIERWVSSYNWDKYVYMYKEPHERLSKLHACVKNADHLVSFLSSSNNNEEILAKEIHNSGHTCMGQSWYLPFDVVHKLPKNKTYVIDFKNIKSDLDKFIEKLNLKIKNKDAILQISKHDYKFEIKNSENIFSTKLSKNNLDFLKEYLEFDFKIHDILLNNFNK